MSRRDRLENAIAVLTARAERFDPPALATTLQVLEDELALLKKQPDAHEPIGRKQITVLFAQIDGLSDLVETMAPERGAALATRIWSSIGSLVEEHGGVVDKHMGEVVMAVFGLPVAREDDVERAVRCAMALSGMVADLEQDEREPPATHLPLSARVGVNTGLVLVGRVGTDETATVIGDAVNVASRLRLAHETPGVYISANTWRFVQHRYEAEALGPVEVKGRLNRVGVYRLERARPPTLLRAARSINGMTVPFVGREREIDRLRDIMQTVQARSRPHMVTISGEAGVGKSRLVSEFSAGLARDGPVALKLEGRSEARLQRVPYSLLRFVVRHHLQQNVTGDAAVATDANERGEDSAKQQFERFLRLPPLIVSGAHDVDADPVAEDGSQVVERQLLSTLADTFRAGGPVLIILEDVHWGDHESLSALERLLALCANLPVLAVCLARPALFERRPHWGHAERLGGEVDHIHLPLAPLDRAQTGTLVQEILRRAPTIPLELVQFVARAAGGNPYYVEELIKVLIDDGVITATEEAWSIHPGRLGRLRVPDTLTGVVQARLDRLPGPERQVLQQAAVIGQEFWTPAVQALNRASRFPLDSDEVGLALQQLIAREMIQPAVSSALPELEAYVFRHDVLREVTYETVLLRDRKPYHLAAAKWLEQYTGERMSEFAAPIAEQYEAAHETEQAATLYEVAAERARQQGQPDRVVQYERRALDMLAGLPQHIARQMAILSRLGQALQGQERREEAIEAYRGLFAAAEIDGDLSQQTGASLNLARLAGESAAYRDMLEWAETAERLAALTGSTAEQTAATSLRDEARRLQSNWRPHHRVSSLE